MKTFAPRILEVE